MTKPNPAKNQQHQDEFTERRIIELSVERKAGPEARDHRWKADRVQTQHVSRDGAGGTQRDDNRKDSRE